MLLIQRELMYHTQLQSNKKMYLFKNISANTSTNNTSELIMNLKSKRSLIRQMLFKEIKKRIILDKPRQSFILRDLVKNMGRYFFGEHGKLINTIPYLKKEYIRLRKIKQLQLKQKINVGDLTYYNFNESQQIRKSRLNEINKKSLTRSSFFFVPKHEVDYSHTHKPRVYSNQLKKKRDMSSKIIPINNYKAIVSDSSYIKHKTMRCSPLSKYQPQSTKSMINKQEKTNSSIINYQNFKNNKTVIATKLENIRKNQLQLEKKLFKIIDRATISTKNRRILSEDKDKLRKLFNMKIKYKNKTTKVMYIETLRTKNTYSMMDPIKAKLIQLSDIIHSLNNKTALQFAENIITEYSEHSKKVIDYLQSRKFEVTLTKVNPIQNKKEKKIGKCSNKCNRH